MPSVLALDPGSKRIGIAASDASARVAIPLETVEVAGDSHLRRIDELIKTRDVRTVVVGLPLRLDGSEGEAAHRARALGDQVGKLSSVEVAFFDERLTTVAAERVPTSGANPPLDQAAATILLQSYLDSLNRS